MRNERSSWNEMGLKECTDRKHMDNQPGIFFIFCTTDGWWGTIEVLYSSGQTLRRNEKHTIGNAWEKGLGIAECISGSYYRSRGVLKCMIGMKVKCSIRGQREERTQLLERNGAKMEIIFCKHMDKQTTKCFFIYCTTVGWWGNIEALRAA